MLRVFVVALLFALPLHAEPATPQEIATEFIGPLIDPGKVAMMDGDRPANTRLYRVIYWLETARQRGGVPSEVMDAAQAAAGYAGTKGAEADKAAIIWSRTKMEKFGCFTPAGMETLRKGGSPEITEGAHSGDKIALDHVLPASVVPELETRFYNLEAVPSVQTLSKNTGIGRRELLLARRWNSDGLLSAKGLKAVEAKSE